MGGRSVLATGHWADGWDWPLATGYWVLGGRVGLGGRAALATGYWLLGGWVGSPTADPGTGRLPLGLELEAISERLCERTKKGSEGLYDLR